MAYAIKICILDPFLSKIFNISNILIEQYIANILLEQYQYPYQYWIFKNCNININIEFSKTSISISILKIRLICIPERTYLMSNNLCPRMTHFGNIWGHSSFTSSFRDQDEICFILDFALENYWQSRFDKYNLNFKFSKRSF